jgi:hypothetical protein
MSEPTFPECSNYEQFRAELGKLPMTWYPDLLRAMTVYAVHKKVFRPGRLADFVAEVERIAPMVSGEEPGRQLCPHHPNVDYRAAWGCPDCVEELRVKLAVTRGLLAEARPLVMGFLCDCANPGNGDLLNRIEADLK